MIWDKYQYKASLLAEALCDADNNHQAADDLKQIGHAQDFLVDWLPPALMKRATTKNPNVNVTAVVLEPGFRFVEQIDAAFQELGLFTTDEP